MARVPPNPPLQYRWAGKRRYVRRKVLQDFANTVCQQFLDLGSAGDVGTFVRRGSGVYSMNLLNGDCSYDGASIPELKVCRGYRLWLAEQLSKHSVPPGLLRAELVVRVVVRQARVRNTVLGAADLEFHCRAELATDERVYAGEMSGPRAWGYWLDRES
jgi:hypothetical protein